jgi:hypothetical protein
LNSHTRITLDQWPELYALWENVTAAAPVPEFPAAAAAASQLRSHDSCYDNNNFWTRFEHFFQSFSIGTSPSLYNFYDVLQPLNFSRRIQFEPLDRKYL